MEAALEAGAEDVVTNDDGSVDVITTPEAHFRMSKPLSRRQVSRRIRGITFSASTSAELDQEAAGKLLRLVDALEDLDDVQDVYNNAGYVGRSSGCHGSTLPNGFIECAVFLV